MKKYEVPAILNGEKVKFVVSVPGWSSDYQAMLYITGKYKNDDIVINSNEITEIVELDLTRGQLT